MLVSSSFCLHIVCKNYCYNCCCLLVLQLQFVGSMAPPKNPANFKFHLFFSRNGGFATLDSALALASTTQNMLHVENVATTFDPQAVGPSSSRIIIDIHEPEFKLLDVQPSKKKKPKWQVQRHFQDTWATKFPWAEVVMGEDGRMHHVRCRICTHVEWREKLLVPKLDGLYKHSGR